MAIPKQMSIQVTITGREILTRTIGTDRRVEEGRLMKIVVQGAPVAVVNPFEPLLSYGDDRLAFRRDHPKYLNLILAVTFLHQMQRPRKHDAELGRLHRNDPR